MWNWIRILLNLGKTVWLVLYLCLSGSMNLNGQRGRNLMVQSLYIGKKKTLVLSSFSANYTYIYK